MEKTFELGVMELSIMALMDDYRRAWALRYLREARVELFAAREAPKRASSMIFNAMRKAQAAIYHSLGDPVLIEEIIQGNLSQESSVEEPLLRCLVEIERSIQEVANLSNAGKEKSSRVAEDVLQIASDIVNLFLSEYRN